MHEAEVLEQVTAISCRTKYYVSDSRLMTEIRKAPVEVPEDHRKGNRRAFPRWKMDFEVRYQVNDKWLDGKPCEIGEGGLSLFADKLVPL